MTNYCINNFPYERVLLLWQPNCDGRGENNITHFTNELDTKHNVLDGHNDSPFGEDHVQNV